MYPLKTGTAVAGGAVGTAAGEASAAGDCGAGVPSADAGCFWHATKEKTVTIAIENAAIAASTFAERRTIEWLCCVIVVHPF